MKSTTDKPYPFAPPPEPEVRIDANPQPGWFERPENVRKLIWGLVAISVAAVVAELIWPNRHPHFGVEHIPGFQAAFGFASFVIVVMLGKALRRIVSRSEDYYDS